MLYKTVQYRCLFLWGLNFHGFLSMVIYEALAICLRYNICSAWFLDIRISNCSKNVTNQQLLLLTSDTWITIQKHINFLPIDSKSLLNAFIYTIILNKIILTSGLHISTVSITVHLALNSIIFSKMDHMHNQENMISLQNRQFCPRIQLVIPLSWFSAILHEIILCYWL